MSWAGEAASGSGGAAPVASLEERTRASAGRKGWKARARSAALVVLTIALGGIAVDRLDVPFVGLVAFAPLFFACRGRSARASFSLAAVAGAGIAAVALRFLPAVLLAAQAATTLVAWLALFALAAGHGLSIGAAFGAAAWARDRGASFGVVASATLALLEVVVPLPLPFAFGAALIASPIAQAADVAGASGLTFVAIMTAAAASELAAFLLRSGSFDRRGLAAGAGLVALAWLYGEARSVQIERSVRAAPTWSAALIQPARTRDRGAPLLLGLPSNGEGALDVIVLPESALPADVPEEELEPLASRLFRGFDAPVIVGARADQQSGRMKNVALAIEPSGALVGRYEKRELVPFSEDDTEQGRDLPPLEIGGVRAAIAICYEDMHAERVRDRVNDAKARVVVDIANDGWLAGTNALELHLAAARLRAIELRRSVLRATNDGVTASIDPLGAVRARAPAGVPARLDAEAPLLEARTIYARVGRPGLFAIAAAFVALTASRRRARS